MVRVGVKPIPTLAHPLPSVDLATGENIDQSRYERSDVCVVPAAGVVGEAMMAIVLKKQQRVATVPCGQAYPRGHLGSSMRRE